jgi:hypothetical protein
VHIYKKIPKETLNDKEARRNPERLKLQRDLLPMKVN